MELTVLSQWLADVVFYTEPRCSDCQCILRMRHRGSIHTFLGVVQESCKRSNIHHNTGTLEKRFVFKVSFARLTLQAVFFMEDATQYHVFDEVILTSKLTSLMLDLKV